MESTLSRIREAVRREGAERYLRLTLLSFAASVILTRLFLGLTGYPQLGGGTLHIAHVLWGGLLLFVAALLPLILANRWVYSAGALLSGVGVGLFIDEVGKFITQRNDYFFPAAAPIIYAFFLLTVLVYLRVRRPPSREPRAELYRALDGLSEVLDHDLDPRELAELSAGLHAVAYRAEEPDLACLAAALLEFLNSDAVRLAPLRPSLWERWQQRLTALEARWLGLRRLRGLLILGFAALGVPGLVALIEAVLVVLTPPALRPSVMDGLVITRQIPAGAGLGWTLTRLGLVVAANLPLLAAALLLLFRREHRGLSLAYFALLFSLSVVNLLTFYYDQFQAVAGALIQFALLMGLLHYRRRLRSRAGTALS